MAKRSADIAGQNSSGGCNANSMQYRGDILKPHTLSCELEKKRVECAIMIKAALMDQE